LNFEELSEENMTNTGDIKDTNALWTEIKSCITITITAEFTCGRHVPTKRQQLNRG